MMFKKSVSIAPLSALVTAERPEPQAVAVAPAPTFNEHIPSPVMTDDLRERYRVLTEKLGISQPGLEADALRAFLQARGIRIYDRAKVEAFLTTHYGKQVEHRWGIEPTWCWRVLLEKHKTDRTARHNGDFTRATAYTKPVPLPVLEAVSEIAGLFPNARFYVSDEVRSTEILRDPFLLVLIGEEPFIIERWDEPAYRE